MAISAELKVQQALTLTLQHAWPHVPKGDHVGRNAHSGQTQANTFPSESAGYLDANCAMGHGLTGLREAID